MLSSERAVYASVHRRPRCEAQIVGVCTTRNQHAHHRHMRSQRGPTDLDNMLAVCDRCHWYIHNPDSTTAPRWSFRHGLLVPSWASYATTPVVAGCPLTCPIDHVGVDS